MAQRFLVKQSSILQVTIALSALAMGILVYLMDRQPESVYFFPHWLSSPTHTGLFFGAVGNYLPTFIHVYVFIILTVVVMAPKAGRMEYICVFWLVVDSLFELGQISIISQWIAAITPDWFSGIPVLENTAAYFTSGTFDYLDIFSIVIGTIAAYLTHRYFTNVVRSETV